MGEGGTPRVTSEVQFPTEGGGMSAPSAAPPAPQQIPRQPVHSGDPLSRPYVLPSRGLYYGDKLPGGQVIIAPTRGAQEELLAGAKGNEGAALQTIRHVATQCITTGKLGFNELLLFDFTAVLFHWLALSAGTDELSLAPVHPACGKASKVKLALGELPCTEIRLAGPEDGTVVWPPPYEEDDPLAILREMDGEAAGGPQELLLPSGAAEEPFQTDPLPHGGDVIGFRYHRVSDLVAAEEFAARAGKQGAGWHNFLTASQIVSINGRALGGRLEAMTWVNNQPSPNLHALREDISLRDFGYDVKPRFRCDQCGGSFRVRLPLDGSLFRRRRRR